MVRSSSRIAEAQKRNRKTSEKASFNEHNLKANKKTQGNKNTKGDVSGGGRKNKAVSQSEKEDSPSDYNCDICSRDKEENEPEMKYKRSEVEIIEDKSLEKSILKMIDDLEIDVLFKRHFKNQELDQKLDISSKQVLQYFFFS